MRGHPREGDALQNDTMNRWDDREHLESQRDTGTARQHPISSVASTSEPAQNNDSGIQELARLGEVSFVRGTGACCRELYSDSATLTMNKCAATMTKQPGFSSW